MIITLDSRLINWRLPRHILTTYYNGLKKVIATENVLFGRHPGGETL